MALIDREAPCRFLQTAFEPSDWVAVFLKNYLTGQTAQRVAPVDRAIAPQFQSWLRSRNADRWNVYVSVNSLRPGRSRARDAVLGIRHVFLEEDTDGPGLLAALTTRPDLPPPSYVLHSSRGRVHVFWRVRGFSAAAVEGIQKRLAVELRTDPAATSCAQTTRLPGFVNYKRETPCAVTLEYLRPGTVFTPNDFPQVTPPASAPSDRTARPERSHSDRRLARARRFLQSVQPAISGCQGDLHTFRICCRVVRGFDLSDDQALSVMSDWNERCQPAWSERELLTKVHNARRYGREAWGGLLRPHA
jgi:hypothetical protein